MVRANVELYKLEQVAIDIITLPLYKRISSEIIDIDDNLVNKFIENEDLAISWLMSLASSRGADMVRVVIPIDNNAIEYAYTVSKRGPITVMVFPRITRVQKVLLLNTVQNSASSREIIINSQSTSEHLRVADLVSEYYVYEIPLFKDLIKTLNSKTIVFQTDDGITVVDCSKLPVKMSSKERTEPAKEKSKKCRKRRKSRKTRRAASPK